MCRWFFIVLVLMAAASANAESCATTSDQSSLNECAGAAWRKSDAALNVIYTKIRRRLAGDAHTLALLTAAQRAWIIFRDAECDFSASGVDGGSAYPMVHLMCADGMTQQRATDMQRYLRCEEGDLSCPVPSPSK